MSEPSFIDAAIQTVPNELIDRLVKACIADGASNREARECVSKIIRFIAEEALVVDVGGRVKSLKRKEIRAIKTIIKANVRSAAAWRSLSDDARTLFLDFVELHLPRFVEPKPDVSLARIMSVHDLFLEIDPEDFEDFAPSPGRRVHPSIGIIAGEALFLWHESTGTYPARTKDKIDSHPTHEFFQCLPLIMSYIYRPEHEVSQQLTERSLLDAASKKIEAWKAPESEL
ncbi:hypothetical protein ACFFUB_08030 [Algimonas porphyrae]|uniref:Uncharacterized protein n=1 Tax=Algimonas porphyrae TaxID=1128113 RepID=A0ABQ5V1G6_9PROT|nr:hypothetical protein [Algimonas porphyrae]GLQ20875.1 hypothetical protein GCM10007854_18300 [Algimonas porphyrae]